MQGSFNYLSKQIGYSTIKLEFYQDIPEKHNHYKRKSIGERIVSALSDGWDIFISFLIGLISLWPFLHLLSCIIILIRMIRKTRKD